MKYVRMPIEVESPEERGYSTIRYNLAESSVTDRTLGEFELDLSGAVLAYGSFLTLAINFIIIAFVLFMVIRFMNKVKRNDAAKPAEPAKPSREEELLTEIRDLLKKA